MQTTRFNSLTMRGNRVKPDNIIQVPTMRANNKVKPDKRLEKAAKLLSMVPTLHVSQALRAENFSDDEADDPALHKRVRSILGKMKSSQNIPPKPPSTLGKPPTRIANKGGRVAIMRSRSPPDEQRRAAAPDDPRRQMKEIRSALLQQRREKARVKAGNTSFNMNNFCVGAVVDRIQEAKDFMAATLDPEVDDEELERLIRVCEGLVEINMGLWRACSQRTKIVRAHIGFRKQTKKHQSNHTNGIEFVSKGLKAGQCVFQREAYSRATVKTPTEEPFLFVLAVPERDERTLNFPPLPSMLRATVQTPFRDDCFIDYEEYLDRALSLNDHVLVILLKQLQSHLEEVQTWLGELDSWASYSDECVSRLEAIFHKKLPCLRNKPTGLGSIVMKKIRCVNCKIELKIDLNKESEILKLQKFLEFSHFLDVDTEARNH